MVTFGASGVADGGHTVLAHVGGSHLTDSTFGSVIEIGLSSPDCLLSRDLVYCWISVRALLHFASDNLRDETQVVV